MLAFNVENVNFEAMPLGFDLIIWGSGLNAALFLKRRWADDALDSWINEWSPALVHYVRWLNDTVPATKKICNVLPLSFRERIRRHVKLEHGKG